MICKRLVINLKRLLRSIANAYEEAKRCEFKYCVKVDNQ